MAESATSRASSAIPRHVPGEPALWVLLFGDMAVFTFLFVFYLRDRRADTALFAESQERLHANIGVINTVILLTSSILVVFALRALRTPHLRQMGAKLALMAVAVGACFVVLKLDEYRDLLSGGVSLTTNDFYMWYFAITGLHLGHVLIGLLILTVLSRMVRDAQKVPTRLLFFEGGACFWHVVDLLWIVIFPLVYLVR